MKQQSVSILYMIIGGLFFLSIPLLFSPHSLLHTQDISHPFFLKELLAYLLTLLFFYANYYYFFPAYYLEKKFIQYTFILLTSMLICICLPSLLIFQQWISDQPVSANGISLNPFLYEINRSFFLFGSSAFASIAFRMSEANAER